MAPARVTDGDSNSSWTHILPTKDLSVVSGHEVLEVEPNLWQEPKATRADRRSVNTIRGLVFDCCQQWNIGHGGRRFPPYLHCHY